MKKPLAKTFQFTFHNLYRLSELLTNTGFEDYLQPKPNRKSNKKSHKHQITVTLFKE